MKRIVILSAVILAVLLMMTGCGGTKTLQCDHCGKDVTVEKTSNMEDHWTIYCEECNEELFGDNPVVSEG